MKKTIKNIYKMSLHRKIIPIYFQALTLYFQKSLKNMFLIKMSLPIDYIF